MLLSLALPETVNMELPTTIAEAEETARKRSVGLSSKDDGDDDEDDKENDDNVYDDGEKLPVTAPDLNTV